MKRKKCSYWIGLYNDLYTDPETSILGSC